MTARDRLALDEILGRCRLIREFTAFGREAFLESRVSQEATYRSFEVMGEAARRVSPATRSAWPKVPWQEMMELRNGMVHSYDQVDPGEVWETVERILRRIERTVARVRV